MKVNAGLIRLEREQRAWSQEHLAIVAGLGLRTIQRIEASGLASYESVRAIAAAYGMQVTDLYAQQDAPAADACEQLPKVSGQAKSEPDWNRLPVFVRIIFLGSSLVRMDRQELVRLEKTASIVAIALCLVGILTLFDFAGPLSTPAAFFMFAGILFTAAYASAVHIRLGDRYRLWPHLVTLKHTHPKRMGLDVLLFMFVTLPLWAQEDGAVADPSPHDMDLVTAEEGVALEVLDWGGNGRHVLLLAGAGDSAHVFDDFAPQLAESFQVYGISRRGFGNSSVPESGYTLRRMAADIAGVIKQLGLEKVIVAGHSMAGEEMHALAAGFPENIAALIYIDAAFNRLDGSEDYDEIAARLPRLSPPSPDDLATVASLRQYFVRNGMPEFPVAEIHNRYTVNADGSLGTPRQPAPQVMQGIMGIMRDMQVNFDPEPVRIPALSLYAAPAAAEDLVQPWYNMQDPDTRADVDALYPAARGRIRRHTQWFHDFAANAEVVEIPGSHYLFLTHPEDTLKAMKAFIASLP